MLRGGEDRPAPHHVRPCSTALTYEAGMVVGVLVGMVVGAGLVEGKAAVGGSSWWGRYDGGLRGKWWWWWWI